MGRNWSFCVLSCKSTACSTVHGHISARDCGWSCSSGLCTFASLLVTLYITDRRGDLRRCSRVGQLRFRSISSTQDVVPARDKPCRLSLFCFNPGDVHLGVGVPDCAGIFQKWPDQRFVNKVPGLCGADLQVPPEKSRSLICLGDNAINVMVELGVTLECYFKVLN